MKLISVFDLAFTGLAEINDEEKIDNILTTTSSYRTIISFLQCAKYLKIDSVRGRKNRSIRLRFLPSKISDIRYSQLKELRYYWIFLEDQ